LNPLQAYFAVVGDLVPARTGGIEGFYTSEWYGVLVLLAWLVVPLLIGLWKLERNDL
jgi:ABC-type transport system involved in multi-copper enzyme maturation permease subunit